jgi:hypothetical protein
VIWLGYVLAAAGRLFMAERHDRQCGAGRALAGPGEAGDRGAGERYLHDVVAAAHRGRAVPLAHPHLHAGDHHALGAEPSDVLFQPAPGVVPRLVHQFGPAGHLRIAGPPASLAGGRPVIVPRPDRDAERETGRYPPRPDQLGEILPADIAGKDSPLPVPGARRANRGADGREIQPAERK